MKRIALSLLLTVLFIFQLNAQSRKEIQIPDIPGYQTLKCDFHMHTVFSDGNVWPAIRVSEAWVQGLDAIAITDHIEYRPHSQDIKSDHNRSYEIAKPLADQAGIILIRGTEITRKMPPGHLNAIFVADANLLERDDWFEACKEAQEQGAFIFWNHPGWKAQQPEKTLWWNEHTRLLEAGILKGIEVYNGKEYYPEALAWANEKGLTMLANSDVHGPIYDSYDPATSHRPVTLVFAAERTSESIRKALENQHTALYFENKLVGDRKFLGPIFNESVEILTENLSLTNKSVRFVQVHNHSDIDFVLKSTHSSVGYTYKKDVVLKAHRTTMIEIKGTSDEIKANPKLKLEYEVMNLTVSPDEKLKVTMDVINFE
jgi:3',5'-nucleoside bisphosphate phosphatase